MNRAMLAPGPLPFLFCRLCRGLTANFLRAVYLEAAANLFRWDELEDKAVDGQWHYFSRITQHTGETNSPPSTV